MFNVLIADDEEPSVTLIRNIIEEYCTGLEVIETANTAQTAIEKIKSYKPDLVILDISFPDGLGFDVLNATVNQSYHTILVSAFEKFAIKAVEFSAISYLLKPVNVSEFKAAVNQFFNKKVHLNSEQIQIAENVFRYNKPEKICISSLDSIDFININEIIKMESDTSYTSIFLLNKQILISTKNIGYYEELLSDSGFIRVHNKMIINTLFIKKYIKGSGGTLELIDGTLIEVSRRKKDNLMEFLNLNFKN